MNRGNAFIDIETPRHRVDVQRSMITHRLPMASLFVRDDTEKFSDAIVPRDQRQRVPLEHRLDRIEIPSLSPKQANHFEL